MKVKGKAENLAIWLTHMVHKIIDKWNEDKDWSRVTYIGNQDNAQSLDFGLLYLGSFSGFFFLQ